MGLYQAWSVYLTTLLLGRLSPLRGKPVLCTFFCQKLTTALLESVEGREWVEIISWSVSTKECYKLTRFIVSGKYLCLLLHKNICCGYSFEVPQGGTSNEYSQHMFSWKNKKNIRLSPLRGKPVLCTFFCQKLTTALLESVEGREWRRNYFMISLHKRMLQIDKVYSFREISLFTPPQKHMLWVLIWSASGRHFKWVLTTYVFMEK